MSAAPLLETRQLTRRFPGVVALDRVDFAAEAGEVHALVGANGAGKSTLMNLLAGLFPPSGGEIRLGGRSVTFPHPAAARAARISIVYQESSAIPELTVAENIHLGYEPANRLGLVDRRRLLAEAQALIDRHQLGLDAAALVRRLGLAARQRVELARALSIAARILILDEPTTVLAGLEVDNLFALIRQLRNRGLLVLYVSHRLEEVLAIADRVSVLRDGRLVATRPRVDLEQRTIIRLMTGRESRSVISLPRVSAEAPWLLRLRYQHQSGNGEVSLTPGEILGLAGLVGSGRSAIARRLIGRGPPGQHTIELDGRPVVIASPRMARQLGILYLTEDRKADGLFAPLSALANTSAAALSEISRWGLIHRRDERQRCGAMLDRLRLVARTLDIPVGELSGGNQQKVLLARALLCRPRVLICDEPTRGIDVGAKEEIYRILIELAGQGVGIILISSEFKELLTLCHRILAIRDGAVVRDFRAKDLDEHELLAAVAGLSSPTRDRQCHVDRAAPRENL